MRLQNHGAKHRRQRQGHEAGKKDRRGHRNAKLAVKRADRPRDKRHRNEYGCHDERNGDDRATDLVKDLHGRPIGRKMLLRHLGVHRLNHHNRVIDHDANRQHHREQGDQVDGEAQQLQNKKVPTNDTGTARVGISVERTSPRNM